jgi:hypothetical protein
MRPHAGGRRSLTAAVTAAAERHSERNKDMKYLVLLYGDPADDPAPDSPEFGPWMEEFMTLDTRMAHVAKVLSGEGLQGVETATCLRNRNGKVETMDGPFAETREHLGGYYLIEAADLDAAMTFAAAIPIARTGTIEIRPVMVYP